MSGNPNHNQINMKNFFSLGDVALFTQAKLFDNGAVALDVGFFQIVEHFATFADETYKGALADLVFLVLLHELGEVLDAIGEKGDLSFGATGIFC